MNSSGRTIEKTFYFGGGLTLLTAGMMLLCHVSDGNAQPPGVRDTTTVRGTVTSFTTAPKGEVDGVMLDDGTWVHWPPHLADRFTKIIAKGDKIKVIGWMETGPKDDTKFEVQTLTNVRTSTSVENDVPPPGPKAKGGKKGPPPPVIGEAKSVQGTVKSFTTAPKGEVDGAMLDDGTWVHWPPHLADRFTDIIDKGDKVKVVGFMQTGPRGDTKLEVSTLTNVRTKKTGENPDPPPPVPNRVVPGKTGDNEERIKALEKQLEELQKELKRLQREK
jgi:hypothetical protein